MGKFKNLQIELIEHREVLQKLRQELALEIPRLMYVPDAQEKVWSRIKALDYVIGKLVMAEPAVVVTNVAGFIQKKGE